MVKKIRIVIIEDEPLMRAGTKYAVSWLSADVAKTTSNEILTICNLILIELKRHNLFKSFYQAGASVVSKFYDEKSLSTALIHVPSGHHLVSQTFSLLSQHEIAVLQSFKFTPLEEKGAALVSIGLSSHEIALTPDRKKSPIDSYRKVMIGKFKASNFHDVVECAKRLGKF